MSLTSSASTVHFFMVSALLASAVRLDCMHGLQLYQRVVRSASERLGTTTVLAGVEQGYGWNWAAPAVDRKFKRPFHAARPARRRGQQPGGARGRAVWPGSAAQGIEVHTTGMPPAG